MKYDPNLRCPRYGDLSIKLIKPFMICLACEYQFTPEANPYIGMKVKINNPLSCWHGLTGIIVELLPCKNYPIRVSFTINKAIYGDIFNPAYLETVNVHNEKET